MKKTVIAKVIQIVILLIKYLSDDVIIMFMHFP